MDAGDRFLVQVYLQDLGATSRVVFLHNCHHFRVAASTQGDLPCGLGVLDPIYGSVECRQPSLPVSHHDGHRSGVEPPAATAPDPEQVVHCGWQP